MKNSSFFKVKIHGVAFSTLSSLFLLCLVIGFIVGVILVFTAPSVYNWCVYLWKDFKMDHDKNLIVWIFTDLILFFMLFMLTLFLTVGYFILLELFLYLIMRGVCFITKCNKDRIMGVFIITFKILAIITPLFLRPSFYRSVTYGPILLTIEFFAAFIIVGLVGTILTHQEIIPENKSK